MFISTQKLVRLKQQVPMTELLMLWIFF